MNRRNVSYAPASLYAPAFMVGRVYVVLYPKDHGGGVCRGLEGIISGYCFGLLDP